MGNLTRKPDEILLNELESGTLVNSGAGATRELFIKNTGTIKLSGVEKFIKGSTSVGTAKTAVMLIKPLYPAGGKNGESGFRVDVIHDVNGEIKDAMHNNKYYDGFVEFLAAANGSFVAITDAIDMAGQIVRAIKSDVGGLVKATQIVPVSVSAVYDFTVKIPQLNKSQRVQIGAAGTISTVKTAIDGGALAGLINVNTASGQLESAYGFTVETTSGLTLSYPKVSITGKEVLPTFTVRMEKECGSIESITDVDRVTFTRKDVARIFPIRPSMAGTQPKNVALPGVEYNKYVFLVFHDKAYALDGANHVNGFRQVLHIYVPKTVAEATNGANFENKLYIFLNGSGHDVSGLAHS